MSLHRHLAALLLAGVSLMPTLSLAQPVPQHRWDFNEIAGRTLPQAVNSGPRPSSWTAGATGVLTTGSGSLALGYNSTTTAQSYAAVNRPAEDGVDGVTRLSVRLSPWNFSNGSETASTRPVLNFGLRNAASTSSSLVADVQFTARAAGVEVVVRDSINTVPIATLPLSLAGPLAVSLSIDRSQSIKTFTLTYRIEVPGGEEFSQTGALSSGSSTRIPAFANLSLRGNLPNGGANQAPQLDFIEVATGPAPPVVLLPPADGRPGMPSNLTTYFSGNRTQVDRAPVGGPALLLMGGGREVSATFQQRAYPVVDGGDVVVLRISGSNGYQDYFYNQMPLGLPANLQPNSVETLIVDSAAKANSAYVANSVSRANLIWIAGGDQSAYIEAWRDTALARAVRQAYARGAVIGGTSAGMVVGGEWMYDPGNLSAVTSAEALADPYRASIILSPSKLFNLPLGYNLIAEPHFANRDRMGRLATFMARLRKDASTALVYGVALDEQGSLFIDRNGMGHFDRIVVDGRPDGNGYILREDRRLTRLTQVSPGLPLIYRNVQRIKLAPGQRFDFARGQSDGAQLMLNFEGATPANAY